MVAAMTGDEIKGDIKFLTLENKTRMHEVDLQVIQSAMTGENLISLTPAQLMELAVAVEKTQQLFKAEAKNVVSSTDRADVVRALRIDDGWTWRGVAAECANLWNGTWGSNQLMGMALCERAAELLGEDFMKEPWN